MPLSLPNIGTGQRLTKIMYANKIKTKAQTNSNRNMAHCVPMTDKIKAGNDHHDSNQRIPNIQ